MFRALPCSFSGGLRRNCIYAASGIVTIPEAAYIQLGRSRVMLETCRGF